MYCRTCGEPVTPGARCVKCSTLAPPAPGAPAAGGWPAGLSGSDSGPLGPPLKSRVAAGLLGLFLGSLGIHRFYLGNWCIGLSQLLLTMAGTVIGIFSAALSWVCCLAFVGAGAGMALILASALWGSIEGILILCGVVKRDAAGRPLG